MSGPVDLLDQLDALLKPILPIPPADHGGPARDNERTSLVIDGLWSTDDYPEYSQTDVLRAYRLGAEDQRALHHPRLSAMPALTAALRAVLALADELRNEANRTTDLTARISLRDASNRLDAALAVLGGTDSGNEQP